MLRNTMYAITCLVALIGFLVVAWITYMSFQKFASDGARLADDLENEEEELLATANEQFKVVNRVGKTMSRLSEDQSEEGLNSFKLK